MGDVVILLWGAGASARMVFWFKKGPTEADRLLFMLFKQTSSEWVCQSMKLLCGVATDRLI